MFYLNRSLTVNTCLKRPASRARSKLPITKNITGAHLGQDVQMQLQTFRGASPGLAPEAQPSACTGGGGGGREPLGAHQGRPALNFPSPCCQMPRNEDYPFLHKVTNRRPTAAECKWERKSKGQRKRMRGSHTACAGEGAPRLPSHSSAARLFYLI